MASNTPDGPGSHATPSDRGDEQFTLASGPNSNTSRVQFGAVRGGVPPSVPQHPPIVAGPVVAPVSASQWSTPLGVVMIVFGVLGSLGGCVTLLGLVFQDTLMGATSPDPAVTDAVRTTTDRYAAVSAISGVVATLLALALAAAGAAVAARRPIGVTVATWWAWLKIAYAVFAVAVGFMAAQDQLATMTATAGGAGAAPGAAGAGQAAGFAVATVVMGPFMLVMMLFQLIWLCALPVFVVVWFRRASIRADIAQWGAGPGVTPGATVRG